MDINTIPDSFAGDLKAFFLSAPPVVFDEKNVRLQHEKANLVSPRLVILCGDPKRVPKMDGTANVPVSMEIVTSMDRSTGEAHQNLAGALQSWWLTIRSQRLSETTFPRCYLHDFLVMPASTIERPRDGERERVTTLRANAIITLFADPQLL